MKALGKTVALMCTCFVLNNAQALDSRYHTFPEIQEFLDSLDQISDFNSIYRVDTIGYSSQEQLPIFAVKISYNAEIKEDEPRVLFIGQIHAEEILGVEAVLKLITEMLDPPPAELQHMDILKQNLETWIIPTLNPEGLNVVHDGLDVSFRKNKKDFSPEGPWPNNYFDYDPAIGEDIDGVDLNRNFDFNWVFGDTFMEPDPSDYAAHYDYYRGTAPWSEPEIRAVRDLALENDYVFSIAWHSSRSGSLSEKVYNSWRWDGDKKTPDNTTIKGIGDQIAELILKENSTDTYQSLYGQTRNGKAHDWFYRATGCFQYLIECGTSNLQPDSALIEDTIDRLMPAMLFLMDRTIGYNTDASQITGIVTDGSTGMPLEDATIIIDELHSGVQKPRKSDEFGRYRRIVEPGTYSVRYEKSGYYPLNFLVTANASSPSTQNVTLVPLPLHNVDITIASFQYPVVLDENPFLVIAKEGISDTIEMDFNHIHSLTIPAGEWEFTIYWDYLIPWRRTITVTGDMELDVNMPQPSWIQYIYGATVVDSSSFSTIIGPWAFDNSIRTQGGLFYANADSLDSIFTLETDLYAFPQEMNVVALRINHQWEFEWDYDSLRIILMDSTDNTIAEMSLSGHHWSEPIRHRLMIADTNGFNNIKVKLEVSRDETINYRGCNINSIELYAGNDYTLGIVTEGPGIGQKSEAVSVTNIYPNPSTGMISIDLINNRQPVTMLVYNLLGQEVHFEKVRPQYRQRQPWRYNLLDNISGTTSSGVYFVKIISEQQTFTRKCVLLKP